MANHESHQSSLRRKEKNKQEKEFRFTLKHILC